MSFRIRRAAVRGKLAAIGRWTVRGACKFLLALAVLAAGAGGGWASTVTIPDSALIPSTTYYTDQIGGGIGQIVVMTGGGNAAGVGDPSGRNDDGFSGPINLGFNVQLFNQTYNQLWVNNNGSVSFTGGISAYTPSGPTGQNVPIISPFFADVDTRNSTSGVVHIRTDIPNEVIVTWDGVGHYDSHGSPFDYFQLVLRGVNYNAPDGEGPIGFFYKSMGWETGDVSGGVAAAVGFGDGSGNGEILQGSTQAGIAGIVSDHHIWFDQNLAPVAATPEPASLTLLGVGALGMVGYTWRRRKSPAVAPTLA